MTKRTALRIVKELPEYYLLLVFILLSFSPPFQFNLYLLTLAVIPVLQIVFRNRYTGTVLGIVFFLFNLLFLGAVISEFSEFSVMSASAIQLISVGLLIWLLNLVMAGTMIYKYLKPSMDPTAGMKTHSV